MAVDYVVQISAAVVTEFYIVFVENFVEFVISEYYHIYIPFMRSVHVCGHCLFCTKTGQILIIHTF